MMSVVVDDDDAVAVEHSLETAFSARELLKRFGHFLKRHPEFVSDGDGGQGVDNVLPTGNDEFDFADSLVAAQHGEFAPARSRLEVDSPVIGVLVQTERNPLPEIESEGGRVWAIRTVKGRLESAA